MTTQKFIDKAYQAGFADITRSARGVASDQTLVGLEKNNAALELLEKSVNDFPEVAKNEDSFHRWFFVCND